MTRRLRHMFKRLEKPAAWALLAGALITFVGVITNFIATGDAKWATLLISADLIVSGVGVVQESEDE